MSNQIKILGRVKDFDPFIINSFLKSYRYMKEEIPNAEYYQTHATLILNYLDHYQLLTAVNPEDENQIFGWLLCDPKTNTLIYSYVKYPFRGFGIFNELCIASGLNWDEQVFYRFQTAPGKAIAKNLNLIYTELL